VNINNVIDNSVCVQIARWLEFGEPADVSEFPAGTTLKIGDVFYQFLPR